MGELHASCHIPAGINVMSGCLAALIDNDSSFVCFFFISAYLYLIIAGRNVPFWVYLFIALLVGFGAWSTIKKIRKQTSKTGEKDEL